MKTPAPHSKGPGKYYPRDDRAWNLMRFAQARTYAMEQLREAKRETDAAARAQIVGFAREWGRKAREFFAAATAPAMRCAA